MFRKDSPFTRVQVKTVLICTLENGLAVQNILNFS